MKEIKKGTVKENHEADEDQLMNEKDSGKKEKVNKLKAGSLLLLGFMIVYIPSVFHWIYGSDISTDIIRMGTIEESYSAQGLLIKDEVLLDVPPFSGRYIREAAEGDRVPASGRAATVLDKSSLSLLEELDKKNIEIVEAQNERAKNTEVYDKDISKIQANIDDNIQLLVRECSSNSLTGVKPLREGINRLIEKRAEIAGTDSKDAHINTLKKERNAIQQRIDSNTKHIISKYAGIVSYSLDGCEQLLTPATMGKLLPKELEAIKPVSVPVNADTVSSGKPFVKVIKGNTIYLAAVLDEEKAGQLKEKVNISIRINDIDKVYSAQVSSISEAAGGKCVVIVKLDRGIEELSGARRVNVDFIKNMYEGLKIPLRCFKEISADGTVGTVVLLKANVTTLRNVDIVGKNNEYAIIKSREGELKKVVSLYDSYIMDSKNVEEGQIINQ